MYLATLLLLLMFGGMMSQELTMKNILNHRKDLQITKNYLDPTNVMQLLGNAQQKNITFFAPSNLAYTRLSRAFRNQLDGTHVTAWEDFFDYHCVKLLWSSQLMNGKQKLKLSTAYKTSYLFINKIKDKIFVNNAEITSPDLVALNGRIHVIDRIFIHQGPKLDVSHGSNAYDYLKAPNSKMYQIFKSYHDNANSGSIQPTLMFGSAVKNYIKNAEAFCTLFVPNNDAIHLYQTKKQDILSKISGQSPGLTKSVVNSLVVPNFAYHVRQLLYLSANQMEIKAIKGTFSVYELNNNVYVKNECGQGRITKSDIVTNNCIIHYIDSFLGVPVNNSYFTMLGMGDLSDFHKTLYSLPSDIRDLLKTNEGFEADVDVSKKYTIFAPRNEIKGFPTDEETKRTQLQMMMIKGVRDLTQITRPIRVETIRSGFYARIRKVGQELYIAVDNVEAKVVEANICTLNGLVYKVDRILGLPDETINEYIQDKNIKMGNILEETGFTTSLINPTNKMTLFAVNQSAIDKLSAAFKGQQNKIKLRDLTARHLGNTVLFLDSIPVGQSFQYQTYNGKVSVLNEEGVFWLSADGDRVKVLKADMKMENGVVHIVSDFLPHQRSSVLFTRDTINSNFLVLSVFLVWNLIF